MSTRRGELDSWALIKDYFLRALDRPIAERGEWLASACQDAGVRVAVLGLLAAHERQDQFMQSPLAGSTLLVMEPAPDRFVGRRVGPWVLRELLGSGGMANVYRAERADDAFAKVVAVKLIKRGLDTDEILGRFQRERQALASLDHPHIARLLDGGSTEDGRPYLVMELIEGMPIDRHVAERRLTLPQVLTLFLKVCAAVQHAHRHLIVHRDLKPSNILVTGAGEPKLLDFGIAKVLQASDAAADATEFSGRPMTLHYASPEQVLGRPVNTATDVYSLGVILYQLVSGERPHRVRATDPHQSMARAICEQEPERPSSVARLASRARVPPELDDILLMTLRKEPERRYLSVEQLAADIERFLRGLPIAARPDTLGYRARKFVRRHRLAVAVSVSVALLLMSAGVLVAHQARVAASERDRAAGAASRAEAINGFLERMLSSPDPRHAGRNVSMRAVVDAAARRVADEFRGQPETEAAVRSTLGLTYLSLGDFDAALEHLEAALCLRRQASDDGGLSLISSLSNAANALYARSDFVRAEALAREAVERARAGGARARELLATSLNNLGAVLRARCELDAAEPCYREALQIRRELFGREHEDIAQTLNNLAGLMVARGDLAAAEPILRDALDMRRDLLGEQHPDVAQSVHNLAVLLEQMGKHDAAEPLFRQSIQSYRELLGDSHPHSPTHCATWPTCTSPAVNGRQQPCCSKSASTSAPRRCPTATGIRPRPRRCSAAAACRWASWNKPRRCCSRAMARSRKHSDPTPRARARPCSRS
ncbi:MAG: serine/threonine-protein kinase [Planctomycetota bacterium]